GRAFAKITLDDTVVTGTEIGRAGDTCWDIGQNFVYRADVTAQVRGNGNYRLSSLLSSNAVAAPDGQGASLVVLYVDPADPKPNYVAINDGAAGQIVFGATPVSTTMRGATLGAGFGNVTITNLVGDGQTGADALTIGATVLGAGDAFHGADGAM